MRRGAPACPCGSAVRGRGRVGAPGNRLRSAAADPRLHGSSWFGSSPPSPRTTPRRDERAGPDDQGRLAGSACTGCRTPAHRRLPGAARRDAGLSGRAQRAYDAALRLDDGKSRRRRGDALVSGSPRARDGGSRRCPGRPRVASRRTRRVAVLCAAGAVRRRGRGATLLAGILVLAPAHFPGRPRHPRARTAVARPPRRAATGALILGSALRRTPARSGSSSTWGALLLSLCAAEGARDSGDLASSASRSCRH